jgi:hypothetical protein
MHFAHYETQREDAALASLAKSREEFERAMTGARLNGPKGPVFGNPVEVQQSAGALEAKIKILRNSLKYEKYDRDAAAQAVQRLTDTARPYFEVRDFHSARQVAWAIREIAKDLQGLEYQADEKTPNFTTIEGMFSLQRQPGMPPVDILFLDLPATQQKKILENNRLMLPGMANYNAAEFAGRLKALNQSPDKLPGPWLSPSP